MELKTLIDIAFLITSFLYVVLFLLLIVIAIYVALILKKIYNFINKVKLEAEKISDDIKKLRENVKNHNFAFMPLIMSFFKVFSKKSKNKK